MRILIFLLFTIASLVGIGKQTTNQLDARLNIERHTRVLDGLSHKRGKDLYKDDLEEICLLATALDTFDCTADFISQTTGCTVSFSDQSSSSGSVTNYYWDFGDGSFSGSSFASHTYASSGTYQVSLTIGTNTGCIDTVTKTVTVSSCGTPVSCDADFISQTDSCTITFSCLLYTSDAADE